MRAIRMRKGRFYGGGKPGAGTDAVEFEIVVRIKAANIRLRFDRVVLGLVSGPGAALSGVIPDNETVLFTLTAPIQLPGRTAAALASRVRAVLAEGEHRETIHGNAVRIRRVIGVPRDAAADRFRAQPRCGCGHYFRLGGTPAARRPSDNRSIAWLGSKPGPLAPAVTPTPAPRLVWSVGRISATPYGTASQCPPNADGGERQRDRPSVPPCSAAMEARFRWFANTVSAAC